jgi:molybdopterin biosynthesis enzyme
VRDRDPRAAERGTRQALEEMVLGRGLPVVLVGGVSAGDPLAPFFAALDDLGGRVLRRGVPAHPGSMIWLARLGESRLLGLPSCGMFALATAADLVLPRLLTGELLEAADLADLGHGGILTREMRFRFPAYARDLEAPEG